MWTVRAGPSTNLDAYSVDGQIFRCSSKLGIAGQVVATGKPIFLNGDIDLNEKFNLLVDAVDGVDVKSVLSVPLRPSSNDRVPFIRFHSP